METLKPSRRPRSQYWLVIIALVGSNLIAAGSQSGSVSGSSSPGTALILGRVLDADTGAPVANAIAAVGELDSAKVRTNTDGYFVFRAMPAGTWTIGAVKEGYLGTGNANRRVSVTLADGERRLDVVVTIQRFAAIGGAVLDEVGEPLVNVAVRLAARTSRGLWQFNSTKQTDDRGEYRFSTLSPGDYLALLPSTQAAVPVDAFDAVVGGGAATSNVRSELVSAGLLGVEKGTSNAWQMGDVLYSLARVPKAPIETSDGRMLVYPTTYYPAAASAATAQTISVTGGEDRSGINLRVAPVPAVAVSGVLTPQDGQSAANVALHIVPADSTLATDLDIASTLTDRSGRFRFPLVPSGSYVIKMVRSPQTPVAPGASAQVDTGSETVAVSVADSPPASGSPARPLLWVSTPLTVGDVEVPNVAAMLGTGHRVTGRLDFDGTAPRPTNAQMARLTLLLEPADGRTGAFLPGRVESDGRFATPQLPPGRYILRCVLPAPWAVRSAMFENRDISDVPLEVAGQDLDGVVVAVTDRLGTVAGTVRSDNGRPAQVATVLAFATDRAFWTDRGPMPRRIKTTRTTIAGAYVIAGLPAGNYFVIAMRDDGRPTPPTDEAMLTLLSRLAVRISLADGDKPTQNLAAIEWPSRPSGPTAMSAWPVLGSPDNENQPATDHGPFVAAPDEQAVRDQLSGGRAGSAVILGTVKSAAGGTQPIHGATITVTSADGVVARTVFTDDAGRFTVVRLPGGRFRVAVSKPAFLPSEFGAQRWGRPGVPIDLADGEQKTVEMTLTRGGVIAGTIFDASGQPLANATVDVFAVKSLGGQISLESVAAAMPTQRDADDRGRYRIYGLPPGSYVIGAGTSPGMAGWAGAMTTDRDVTDARRGASGSAAPGAPSASTSGAPSPPGRPVAPVPTFYPSSATLAAAQTITLAPGEERSGIDVTVGLVSTARLTGRVVAPDGSLAAGARLVLFPTGPYLPASSMQVGTSSNVMLSGGGRTNLTTTKDGGFDVGSLRPGSYTLFARGGGAGSSSPSLWAVSDVTVADRDLADFVVTLQPGLTLSGLATFQGTAPPPDPGRLRVGLTGSASSVTGISVSGVQPDVSGRFKVTGLTPGSYSLALTNVPAPWILTRAMLNGRDVADRPLEIGVAASPGEVTLIFGDRASELSGRLTDAGGRPAGEYFVILFPTDQSYWMAKSRRIQAVRPSADGRFLFSNLPPGSYQVATVTDVEPNEWYDPPFLEMLRSGSVTVELAEAEKKTQDLRIRGATR